jgi:nicotinamidase-related amidase
MSTHHHVPSSPRSALLLIDLANDFLYPGGVIADAGGADYQTRAQAIVPVLARLVAAARDGGILVVYATDAHRADDAELRKWPPHAMQGTPQAGIAPALRPRAGDLIIEKRTYSPFVSSTIDEQLRQRGIERLYIAGLHTDCCARHTSGDAFQRGYDLVWITDGMQAFTEEGHREGLEYFRTWYASDASRQLKTADELIVEWSRRAEEPAAVGSTA